VIALAWINEIEVVIARRVGNGVGNQDGVQLRRAGVTGRLPPPSDA
jgi:hypothetical protein